MKELFPFQTNVKITETEEISVSASAKQIILQKNGAEPFRAARQEQIFNLLTAYPE